MSFIHRNVIKCITFLTFLLFFRTHLQFKKYQLLFLLYRWQHVVSSYTELKLSKMAASTLQNTKLIPPCHGWQWFSYSNKSSLTVDNIFLNNHKCPLWQNVTNKISPIPVKNISFRCCPTILCPWCLVITMQAY